MVSCYCEIQISRLHPELPQYFTCRAANLSNALIGYLTNNFWIS